MKAYKIAKINEIGKFVSFLIESPELVIEYKLGEKIEPKYPAFLFRNLQSAQFYMSLKTTGRDNPLCFVILECEIEEYPFNEKFVCHPIFESDFAHFWETGEINTVRMEIPKDTVLASSIIPLKIVDQR